MQSAVGLGLGVTRPRSGSENLIESLIIPVYKNSENISELLKTVEGIAARRGDCFEAIFVVDGSPDDSYERLAKSMKSRPFSCRLISLNRNEGAFSALKIGIQWARGEFIAVMSADLQEPPELIYKFFETLKKGSADILFGCRTGRPEAFAEKIYSRLYWSFYRLFVLKEMPSGGVDVFAFNGRIRQELLKLREPSGLLVTQLFRLGGNRHLLIPYERQQRNKGKSAWSLKKKLNYAVGSICYYASYRVIFFLGLAGIVTAEMLFFGMVRFLSPDLPLRLGPLFAASVFLAGAGTLICFWRRARPSEKEKPGLDILIKDYKQEKDRVERNKGNQISKIEPESGVQQRGSFSLYPLPCHHDERGDLVALEFARDIPFIPKRNFFISGVKAGEKRGGHAHKQCRFFLVALSGVLKVKVDDGKNKADFILDSPREGLYISEWVWSVQYDFSKDALLCVYATHEYSADDYIHDYQEFMRYVQ